jgi:hypothetical protein
MTFASVCTSRSPGMLAAPDAGSTSKRGERR